MARAGLRAARLAPALLAALTGTAPGVAGAMQTGTTPAGQGQAAQSTQGPASLVADKVQVEGNRRLIAEGHVLVTYQGARLQAAKVIYDKAKDRLAISGPIHLTTANGTVLMASSADLSPDLRDGILRSARLVLDRQLQLAAAQINRVGGRYTQMTKTVASSCLVSDSNPTPLWEIRASRVVHDQQRRQLYFDNPRFRLFGVPIFYLPRLRIPDPSLKRATGFLLPSFGNSSLLGFGVSMPYFIALGDSRDLMLTPFLATRSTTLKFRYRQALRSGGMEWNGAVSHDKVRGGGLRGYLFANGDFALRDGYRLRFNIQTVSDAAYLTDYGISNIDRLQSDIELSRTRRDDYSSARLYSFHSIRAGDNNATLPGVVAGYTRIHRFTLPGLGGQGSLTFDSFGLLRTSNQDVVGRDEARASIRLDWRRSWVIGPGIVVSALARTTSDLYAFAQDSQVPGTVARTIPVGAVELRWPLVKAERGGGSQVLEPIVQLIVSPRNVPSVPNEDSTQLAFDAGNLWSLDRYPGYDGIEYGPRANVGLRWTRYSASGWTLGAVAGRVFRLQARQGFSAGSGLGGARSDWLTGVRLASPHGLSLTGRAIFNDQLTLARSEAQLGWTTRKVTLATSYIWMVADPAENLPTNTSEWALDANWRVSSRWTGRASWRYDFQADRATSAGLGLNWHNECLGVDLYLSRRFTSSTSVAATTNLALSVDLIGIAGRAVSGDTGTCGG
ncbi:hypothetical protein U879_02820 [Defluviimonas sp. 20V17]|uniref:LPS-assembly protein LptD n=1 Tax=Allgaiera indica TaxID=765699 RepID=A0AAN4UV84_9RHOB|nr:LPS assembly protein LptD [Allgaiera indica]KDB05196.1 hypothetical protein U879_02820 [Defluviimonas sp. 20V17]GHE05312.1 LPS-assembly protein LptD [Allgaiera indica]SDX63111.1 LPS-assembly protein [Allgaiera indica]